MYMYMYINRWPHPIPGPNLILGPDLFPGPHRLAGLHLIFETTQPLSFGPLFLRDIHFFSNVVFFVFVGKPYYRNVCIDLGSLQFLLKKHDLAL